MFYFKFLPIELNHIIDSFYYNTHACAKLLQSVGNFGTYQSLKIWSRPKYFDKRLYSEFERIRQLTHQYYCRVVFNKHHDSQKQNRQNYDTIIKVKYKDNPAQRKLKLNETIECQCGKQFNRYSLNRHLNSYVHFEYFRRYTPYFHNLGRWDFDRYLENANQA